MNWLSIGSCNGFSPIQRQAITWTNAGIWSIWLLGTNFSEIRIGIVLFSFKKMHLKLSSARMGAILSRGRWVNIWCRDKMAVMLQTTFLLYFSYRYCCILIKILPKFVFKGSVNGYFLYSCKWNLWYLSWLIPVRSYLSGASMCPKTETPLYKHSAIKRNEYRFEIHNYYICSQDKQLKKYIEPRDTHEIVYKMARCRIFHGLSHTVCYHIDCVYITLHIMYVSLCGRFKRDGSNHDEIP